jgi:hypothetical protein
LEGDWGDLDTKKTLFDVFNENLAFQMKFFHFGSVGILHFLLVYTLIGHSKFVQLFFIDHFCTYWLKD